MASTFVAATSSGDDAQSTTYTTNKPAGTSSGNLVLLHIVMWNSANSFPTVTPPSGFVQVGSTVTSGVSGNGNFIQSRVYGGVAASETSYTMTLSTAFWGALCAESWSGADTSSIATLASNGATGSGTAVPSTSATSAAGDGAAHFVNTMDYPGSATHTPPTGFTEAIDNNPEAANYQTGLSAGTTTASGATVNASQVINAILVIVKASGGGGTNGSVTAVAATASVAAVAPVVTGVRNGSVTAVVATINTAAVAPTVSTGVNGSVTAVVATASLAAPAPVVTGIRNATVSAVKATINSAAVAPVVAGEAVVSGGGPASISLAAIAPVVTGIRNASVTAVKATIAVAANAPTVDTSGSATVNAVKATVSVAAVAPVVAAGSSVTAVKATLTTAAVAPSVAVNAFVQAVAATLTVAAPAPVVFSPDARVNAVAAGILVTAIAPARVGAQQTIYIFTPPTTEIRHRFRMPEDGLMRRIGIPTGETLIKESGFYTLTEAPVTDERIEAADAIYFGGHEYTLTPQEVTDLTNAGYGGNIRQELQG